MKQKVSNGLLTKDFMVQTGYFHLSLHLVEEEMKYSEYKLWVCSRNRNASDHLVFTFEQLQSAYCDLFVFITFRIALKKLFHLI